MLKKSLWVLGIVSVLAIGQVSILFAGGYESPGLGAKALSMGGAFIGLADDWTAVYWNPAGLTQLKNKGIGLSLTQPNPKIKDGNSVANPNQADMSIDQNDVFTRIPSAPYNEPTYFNKEEVTTHLYNPGIGGYTQWRDFVIGGGIYVPISNKMDWDDTIKDLNTNADIYGAYKTSLYMMVTTISLAKEITPELSVGGGINYLYGKLTQDAKKKYTCAAIPALNYTFNSESDGSGTGFEGIIGLMYKPKPELNIGMVYRTGSKIDLDGSAKTQHTLLGINESSDYTQKVHHPTTYGIGIAYRYNPRLTLTSDFARTDWTTMGKEIDFETAGLVVLKDISKDLDWKVTNRVRLGGEYKLDDKMLLRGGFSLDPAAVPDKGVSLTNLVEVDKKFITLGLSRGYTWHNLLVDATYEYAWGDREINNVNYNYHSYAFTLAGICQF
ncbi:MAG: outer membrane protein transport protein [bacterium]